MWTPPHFWALALYRAGDYAKAGVPMLPVVAGAADDPAADADLHARCWRRWRWLPWRCIGLPAPVYGAAALALGRVFLGHARRGVLRDRGERASLPREAHVRASRSSICSCCSRCWSVDRLCGLGAGSRCRAPTNAASSNAAGAGATSRCLGVLPSLVVLFYVIPMVKMGGNDRAGHGCAGRKRRSRAARRSLAAVAGDAGRHRRSVPLYRVFCAVTGYGGTPQHRRLGDQRQCPSARSRCASTADTDPDLPWRFAPASADDASSSASSTLAFYAADNNSAEHAVTGMAVYNVTPRQGRAVFRQDRLLLLRRADAGAAAARARCRSSFFVDPAICADRDRATLP